MTFVECPAQVLFWCNFGDAIITIVLAMMAIVLVLILFLFVYFRGDWGKTFYHSDKSQVGVQVEQEGDVQAYHMRDFGALKRVVSGKLKGAFVLPRAGAAFKSAKAPLFSIVLGGGLGMAANPFLAAYVERLGGKWPEWSGSPPPGKPRDLDQFYLMYAKWKARGEKSSEADRNLYVTRRLAETDVPATFSSKEDIDNFIHGMKLEFGAEYDKGAYGPFTAMAARLSKPAQPDDPKDTFERSGIYETLNGAIQSEPKELWPAWIAGVQVDARELARYAQPLSGAEIESAMNRIEDAIKKNSGAVVKYIAVGLMVLLILVGVAVLLSRA